MSSNRIKSIISPICRILPVEKLLPSVGSRFIFPFWHAVSDTPPPHLAQLYCVPAISDFVRDLDFFLKTYKPASIEDVSGYVDQGRKTDQKFFFPTFDDGLAECYHVIAPILKKKGIRAAFFINPSFVDNKALFHRHKASIVLNRINSQPPKPAELKEAEQLVQRKYVGKNLRHFLHHSVFTDHEQLDQIAAILDVDFNLFLTQHQPYMTLNQIRELQNDGFWIGAHGMDHREFFRSSEEEINIQISASMDFLNQELQPPVKLFAFPFTDFKVPDSVFEKANQSKIWDLSFGTAGMKDEHMPNHLQRIPMESNKNEAGKQVVRTEYLWYYLKWIFGKNKVSRQ